MNIILVTASFNDEVHGTFNDKKTGCGINLLRPENVTRYRRGGRMTDLGELTCERCKTKIAKEMIRSDQKEMKALLKEERMRAKKGIEDEGIVPLGNTTARITSAPTVKEPEPEVAPAPPKPAYQPNGAPALDDSLAQFAIKRPDAEPEAPSENQFVYERQKLFDDTPAAPVQEAVPEPAPAPQAAPEDDFLAQFAIQKPDDEPDAPQTAPEDDFLAQFAISAPAPEPQAQPEEPAAPPVIDDISGALAAMDQMPYGHAPAAAPVQEQSAPAGQSEYTSDWDAIANQLFGGAPQQQAAPQPPVIEDIAPAPAPAPVSQAPVIQDIAPAPAPAPVPQAPVIQDIAPAPMQSTPVIDDISSALNALNTPVQPAAPAPAPQAPVLDDIAPVAAPQVPVLEDIAPAPAPQHKAPSIEEWLSEDDEDDDDDLILEDIDDDDDDDDELEYIAETLEPKTSPVINDIGDAISAMNVPGAPQPKAAPAPAPAPVQSAPVLDDISSAINALNTPVQPAAPAPVQPVPVQRVAPAPVPVQPVAPAPAPVPVQPVAPAVQAAPVNAAPGAVGQILSVPQLTGYNSSNQPVYTYIQMQIQGYDANGQPVLAPLPGQTIPVAPQQPSTFSAAFKNARLQDAIAAAQEIPTSSKDMTPGQRIAAAEAAKGSPVTANVSKIATNPHTRSTSQAFISAISVSKEYANQSLTETQGLQQRTGVLDSIEDVLSQLGDNTLKEKKIAAAKAAAQTNVPDYQEFKLPAKTPYSPQRRTTSAASRPASAPVDDRPLTKAELKARKKQEKIDAKFQKEMAKRK